MRTFRFVVGAPVVAAALLVVGLGAALVSAQGTEVRINGAIDKLAKGKSLAGAIMYDFSLYAAAEVVYMTYHLDWTVFLFAHTIAEVLDLAAFVLVFAGAVAHVTFRRTAVQPSRG